MTSTFCLIRWTTFRSYLKILSRPLRSFSAQISLSSENWEICGLVTFLFAFNCLCKIRCMRQKILSSRLTLKFFKTKRPKTILITLTIAFLCLLLTYVRNFYQFQVRQLQTDVEKYCHQLQKPNTFTYGWFLLENRIHQDNHVILNKTVPRTSAHVYV